jgi:cytochrome c biogenesis protein CcmG/thiol:disulfide interchange protein DsbE
VSSDVPPASAPPPPRQKHAARWIGLAVLVIGAGLIAVLATRPSAQAVETYSPLVGEQAPAISGQTVDGTVFSMPRAPGRYEVVNFFASWCIPCQEEGPELVKFEFQHRQSGDASVVSVVYTDTVSQARAYQQTLGATWPTMADTSGTIAYQFGVRSPPSTFVVAPDGRVVAFVTSSVTAAQLDSIISGAKLGNP